MRHYQASGHVRASAEALFALLDDHERLSAHMSRSSWMMGGGRMKIDFDEARGRRVGSHIGLAGKIFGVELSLEEVVTERTPPHRKIWETIGAPRLLVVGRYRMGFEITAEEDRSTLRVFIDYELPSAAPGRWLGRLFGPFYARWCVRRMVGDAVKYFSVKENQHG